MTAAWLAGRPVPRTRVPAAGAAAADLGHTAAARDAARALATLYAAHYRPLVQLAVWLVGDRATAEDVVQDSFVAMHAHWRRLKDSGKAVAYLRQCVLNRSRSVLRHQKVVDRKAPQPLPDMPSAEEGALALLEQSAVAAALKALPARQREVVVLRYFADLSGPQIASAMGITPGSVKSHNARALLALRGALEQNIPGTGQGEEPGPGAAGA